MKIELDDGEAAMLKLGEQFKIEADKDFFDAIEGVVGDDGDDGVEVKCLALEDEGEWLGEEEFLIFEGGVWIGCVEDMLGCG
jgi:hypothetical protein